MTPKEKAIELVHKYIPCTLDRSICEYKMSEKIAKKCALIAVEEILKVIDDYNDSELCHQTLLQVANDRYYWTEVNAEIDNI